MKMEQIVDELKFYNGYFPKKAVEKALENPKKITPKLLEFLDYTMNNLDNMLDGQDEFCGYNYAIFLLANFKEKRLFPYLIELMKMGEDVLEYIIGDDYLDTLPRLLASTYNGDDQSLLDIFNDESIDDIDRSCILTTFSILYLEGIKSRDFLIECFRNLINNRGNKESYIYDGLLQEITNIKLIELKEDGKKLKKLLVEDESYQEFIDVMNGNDYSLNRNTYPLCKHYEYIHDIIEMMEGWECFLYKEREEFKSSPVYFYLKKINEENDLLSKKNKLLKDDKKTLDLMNYFIAIAIWYQENEKDKRAIENYRYAYFDIIDICKKYKIKIVDECEEKFKCVELFSNWFQDFLMLLYNNSEDKSIVYDRIMFYDMFEETFDMNDESNLYWKEELIRERANALFSIGKEEEATLLIENYLKVNPLWLWGYIEMADWYSFKKDSSYNPNRAIEILKRTEELGIEDDMDAVYERLRDLYKDIGDNKKSNEYKSKC